MYTVRQCRAGKGRKHGMMKRTAAWLMVLVVLLAAVPAACAEKSSMVEDFTVEQADSGIIVNLPEGYSAKGFFKLFWKNGETGEVQSAVIPADTPSYPVETEPGAEYSFQLFYAKKRGLLPSSWKEEKKDTGPVEWKVLWIDADTIEFDGYTNRMSEKNRRDSGELAEAFEALAEELTGGLVDIRITRMSLEEPITGLVYATNTGYFVDGDAVDASHWALRKYDSVFVVGRMDGIYLTYAGVATQPDDPREEPGYSFIPLVYEDPTLLIGCDLKYVAIHEWLHQLGYLYSDYRLEIPSPDEGDKYGYDRVGGRTDPDYFREILTMKAITDDGRYVGVPAEAWEYRPTHSSMIGSLASLQGQTVPEELRRQAKEPAPTAVPKDPEIYGTITETAYENAVMGIGCAFDDWVAYAHDQLPFTPSASEVPEGAAGFLKDNDNAIVFFTENAEKPESVTFSVNTSFVPFVEENGEEAFLQEIKKLYELRADAAKDETLRCEPVQITVGDRTLHGLKVEYVSASVDMYMMEFAWLNDSHLCTLVITTCMHDTCEELTEHLYLTDF